MKRTPEQLRKHAARMRRWRKENPEEAKRQDRARYKRNKRQARNLQLRIRFGITLTQYEALRTKQGNRCAVCATDEPRGRGDWHVDHKHSTGSIRGLLCHSCNVGLGNFRDDPILLDKAAAYLRKTELLAKLF